MKYLKSIYENIKPTNNKEYYIGEIIKIMDNFGYSEYYLPYSDGFQYNRIINENNIYLVEIGINPKKVYINS